MSRVVRSSRIPEPRRQMLGSTPAPTGELTTELITTLLFQVIGGLGIFLLGMKYMSEGMQAVAGQRLRKMISAVTDNRFLGIGTGTLVTCVVQSSSITTVLVVGFVSSGLMALHQAIGVIMGANIGTTITGWILVLQIGKYGLPLLGASAFVYLFSKNEGRRFTALAFMGLGMVFYGLLLMKDGFSPIREIEAFHQAFEWFEASSFLGVIKCVLIGSILTAIVQSSSATLGITIAIAAQGVISYETAVALVLGQNIGTTVTAALASIGTTSVARRAAYFHILFNTMGVVVVLIVFRYYVDAVGWVVSGLRGIDPHTLDPQHEDFAVNMTFAIAMAHTIFNVLVTVANVPFVAHWARLLERIVPDKVGKEIGHLTQLDMRLIESPGLAIERSKHEIVKMGEGATKMMRWAAQIITTKSGDPKLIERLFHREKVMDNVQTEVIHFLTDLLSANVPHSVAREGRLHLRVADEVESITDYISAVLKNHLTLQQHNLELTESERLATDTLHEDVFNSLVAVLGAFHDDNGRFVRQATLNHNKITRDVKDFRTQHLQRLSDERVDPIASLEYTRILLGYRKISDHILNIAEAVAIES
jgi:phosphate:Na+ symporter